MLHLVLGPLELDPNLEVFLETLEVLLKPPPVLEAVLLKPPPVLEAVLLKPHQVLEGVLLKPPPVLERPES